MLKRGRTIYPRTGRKLYLGEWLARLKKKPAELARAVKVSPGYISELISGAKPSPSIALLLAISDFLGLTVNDLYLPPPPLSATEAVDNLNPAQLATLARLLDEMKPKSRR